MCALALAGPRAVLKMDIAALVNRRPLSVAAEFRGEIAGCGGFLERIAEFTRDLHASGPYQFLQLILPAIFQIHLLPRDARGLRDVLAIHERDALPIGSRRRQRVHALDQSLTIARSGG